MRNVFKTSFSSHKFYCRKLEVDDLENVMHWRMSQHVTKFLNTDPMLTLDEQKRWFEELGKSGVFYYWIIEVDKIPCGVIYLSDIDMSNKRCTWGYYVAQKQLRSFNLAMSLEMSLYDYVFNKIALNKITGESFCINVVAVKMHELCGCKTDGILRQHIYKNGQYYDVCVQSMLAEDWQNLRGSFEYQQIDFN